MDSSSVSFDFYCSLIREKRRPSELDISASYTFLYFKKSEGSLAFYDRILSAFFTRSSVGASTPCNGYSSPNASHL